MTALVRSRQAVGLRGMAFALLSLLFLPAVATTARAQDLGHKVLGAAGIDAGTQPAPGLYLSDRLIRFDARTLRDRHGGAVRLEGLDIDALANVIGASLVLKPRGAPYLSFAFGVPVAGVSVSVDDPRISVDRSGFGDLFVQPFKAGWRTPRLDVVTSYSVYAPTGRFEPRGGSGVGRGFWTHQLSLGAAVRGNPARRARVSALASYDLNGPKRKIDIQRGNTVQVQGGAGMRVHDLVDVGVAGFGLWQVTDDRGADVPAALRGARDRVFGLGPEIGILVPALRMRLDLRSEWEFGARSRPQGRVLVASLTAVAWRPVPRTEGAQSVERADVGDGLRARRGEGGMAARDVAEERPRQPW
jgi:hypothetical protein